MPPQTPFLSVIFVSLHSLHDFYNDVEVGWHVVALFNNFGQYIFKFSFELKNVGSRNHAKNIS
jgi:hypothetical protein